jgi:nitroreductase
MSTAVLEAIKHRRSVRAYSDEPLTKGQVDALVHAAAASPSAHNGQPWRFVVAEDAALIKEMEADAIARFAQLGEFDRIEGKDAVLFYGAPLVIFIAIDESEYANTDCGIAAENISLAAAGMGLGSLIVGMGRLIFEFDKEKWEKKLGFPEGFRFGLAVAVGHAAGFGRPHEPDLSKVSYIRG